MTEPNEILQIFNDVLKYKEKYEGQLVVIKLGGALVEDNEVIANIAKEAAFLTHNFDIRVILVHGGGKQIDARLTEKDIEIQKDAQTGLRITSADTLDVSDQVLRGLNGKIVTIFNQVAPNIRAIGMAGYEGRTITATQNPKTETGQDNYTGHITKIDNQYLEHLMNYDGGDLIPIIYPICHSENSTGENRLNVNADEVAGMIAAHLGAKRLILCSDIPGVLDENKEIIRAMSVDDVVKAIDDGVVTGGMIQKLRTAAHAAENLASGSVVILDGHVSGSILAEFMYEKGNGTLISKSKKLEQKTDVQQNPALN